MRWWVVAGWLLVSGTLALVAGIVLRMWLAPAMPAPEEFAPIINITYPYVASPEREWQIRAGLKQVKLGMSVAQVSDSLGTADEVQPLYEPQILHPRRIGSTFWYFLEKKASDNTHDIRVFRVSFDLDGHVTHVDHWGLDDGNAPKPHR